MASFQFLCEALLTKDKGGPPKVAEDDNRMIAAIKTGLNTRADNKEGSTFWDDFMRVCGDAESLSHLLGVSKYQIAGWPSKVRKYLKIVHEEMAGEEANKGKRHNMINTGMGDNASAQFSSKGPEAVAPQGDMAGPNVFGRS
jgi:hypothetical protein